MSILPFADLGLTTGGLSGGTQSSGATGDGSLFAALLNMTANSGDATDPQALLAALSGSGTQTNTTDLQSILSALGIEEGAPGAIGEAAAALAATLDGTNTEGAADGDPLAAQNIIAGLASNQTPQQAATTHTHSPIPAGAGTGHPPATPQPRPVSAATSGPSSDAEITTALAAATQRPTTSAAATTAAAATTTTQSATDPDGDPALAQLLAGARVRPHGGANHQMGGDAKPATASIATTGAAAVATSGTSVVQGEQTASAADTTKAQNPLDRLLGEATDQRQQPAETPRPVLVARPAAAPGQPALMELQKVDGSSPPIVVEVAAAPISATSTNPIVTTNGTAAALPVNAIAVAITRQANAGNNRFQIRLDPPELGRIDIRLDLNRDGQVNTRLMVDNPDTYEAIQRDPRGLERALSNAGLKLDDGSVQVSLRDSNQFGQREQAQRDHQEFARQAYNANNASESDDAETTLQVWQMGGPGDGRLDLSV